MEREEQEAAVKINDRRKFNVDGSLREGVEIAPEKPKEETKPVEQKAAEKNDEAKTATVETGETEADENLSAEDERELAELGADDPASFVNFLTTLISQAAAALGAMPHPVTGQRTLDLETGKYWIDVLAMLKEKTDGNLHPKEEELFKGLLSDLQMQYVQVSRMAEEKLKQQAAQKFSANDILGKR
ncbi:MAG: DUF1844 domain-containing protein [Pyrinomonadaceae bacterium]